MTANELSFVSELRATGHGEVWDHTDTKKFKQFGWRCTTNENEYEPQTLVGNWNEQRFDIARMSQAKPIPSQFSHYFETTYDQGFNAKDTSKVPPALKHLQEREPNSFPGHQPEIDPPRHKTTYNSFMTTSRAAFGDPSKMK